MLCKEMIWNDERTATSPKLFLDLLGQCAGFFHHPLLQVVILNHVAGSPLVDAAIDIVHSPSTHNRGFWSAYYLGSATKSHFLRWLLLCFYGKRFGTHNRSISHFPQILLKPNPLHFSFAFIFCSLKSIKYKWFVSCVSKNTNSDNSFGWINSIYG